MTIDSPEAFIDKLRSLGRGLIVQAVNANFIAGREHINGVLHQSIEARKRGILLSQRMEIDILLRLACTNQIIKALKCIGLKDGKNEKVLIIAIGKLASLKILRKHLVRNYQIDKKILRVSERNLKLISKLHNISKKEQAQLVDKKENGLAEILVERACLL